MKTQRLPGLAGALCLGFLLGVMLAGDAYKIAALFAGAGAAVMVAACVLADAS